MSEQRRGRGAVLLLVHPCLFSALLWLIAWEKQWPACENAPRGGHCFSDGCGLMSNDFPVSSAQMPRGEGLRSCSGAALTGRLCPCWLRLLIGSASCWLHLLLAPPLLAPSTGSASLLAPPYWLHLPVGSTLLAPPPFGSAPIGSALKESPKVGFPEAGVHPLSPALIPSEIGSPCPGLQLPSPPSPRQPGRPVAPDCSTQRLCSSTVKVW